MNGQIRSVADTALWVASLRALEAARGDAVIHDEWAATLAGERGHAIARSMSPAALVAWGVVVRTSALDRLVGEVLATGVDMVINLGAGMDMRPYRLAVPPAVRWIEIDLPDLIGAKETLLRGREARCAVERLALDLRDGDARRAVFRRFGAQSRNALIIAEGVVPYLSNEAAAGLAADLASIAAFRHWLLDFDNAGRRPPPRRWQPALHSAPFLFQVDDWFDFFRRCGWRPERVVTSADESVRIQRPFPLIFPRGWLMRLLPASVRERIMSVSGAALLTRDPSVSAG